MNETPRKEAIEYAYKLWIKRNDMRLSDHNRQLIREELKHVCNKFQIVLKDFIEYHEEEQSNI